jgi:hypothetical protein
VKKIYALSFIAVFSVSVVCAQEGLSLGLGIQASSYADHGIVTGLTFNADYILGDVFAPGIVAIFDYAVKNVNLADDESAFMGVRAEPFLRLYFLRIFAILGAWDSWQSVVMPFIQANVGILQEFGGPMSLVTVGSIGIRFILGDFYLEPYARYSFPGVPGGGLVFGRKITFPGKKR